MMKASIISIFLSITSLSVQAQIYDDCKTAREFLKQICEEERKVTLFYQDAAEYYGCKTELERRAFKSNADYQQKCDDFNRLRQEYISGHSQMSVAEA